MKPRAKRQSTSGSRPSAPSALRISTRSIRVHSDNGHGCGWDTWFTNWLKPWGLSGHAAT